MGTIRRAPGTNPQWRSGSSARTRTPRPCASCDRPSLALDVAAILHPGDVSSTHKKHIARAITESSKFKSGSHGDRIVEALEWSAEKAKAICEEALVNSQPRVALDALRVISDIVANEAKIIGAIPRANQTHIHMPALTPTQAKLLLEDYAATTLEVEAKDVESSD